MAKTRKGRSTDDRALQLKIQLIGTEPEIWRRVLVPSTLTLLELHAVIQAAMGWQDCHLHMFEIAGQRYEVPEDDQVGPEEGYQDERAWAIGSVLPEDIQFLYIYDFGDNWRHSITVEGRVEPLMEHYLPLCVDGALACPPEDSGGIWSYPEFLATLADPAHPEHDDTLEWARGFDPVLFNITQANALIQAMIALYDERGWGFYSRQPW